MIKTFRVYVVELDLRRSFYVGSTGQATSSRMWKHLTGRHASRYVREHGVRLRPDLVRGLGPFETRREAMRAEKHLAEKLKARGYRVYGACNHCAL